MALPRRQIVVPPSARTRLMRRQAARQIATFVEKCRQLRGRHDDGEIGDVDLVAGNDAVEPDRHARGCVPDELDVRPAPGRHDDQSCASKHDSNVMWRQIMAKPRAATARRGAARGCRCERFVDA